MPGKLPTIEELMKALLRNIAVPSKCKGCGVTMFMVRHLNGRLAPYTEDGLNHFVNCPQAAMFRERKD